MNVARATGTNNVRGSSSNVTDPPEVKGGGLERTSEKSAERGKNEFQLRKYEARDGFVVRFGHRIFAGWLFSISCARVKPRPASGERDSGDGSRLGSTSNAIGCR